MHRKFTLCVFPEILFSTSRQFACVKLKELSVTSKLICIYYGILTGYFVCFLIKVVRAAFVPFGDLVDCQIPLDYETEKHRGFAFVEFELAEDAKAAIDNMVSHQLDIMHEYKLRVIFAKLFI